MSDDVPQWINDFIKTAPWQEAKTFRYSWPHEYCVKTPFFVENALAITVVA